MNAIQETSEENSTEAKPIGKSCCCKCTVSLSTVLMVVIIFIKGLARAYVSQKREEISIPVDFGGIRQIRDLLPNSNDVKPEIDNYSSIYSAEAITLIVIIMIEYILTGLVFWYSKKGKYKLIFPYLIFLILAINASLDLFIPATIQSFKLSMQAGFLVLTIGFLIIGKNNSIQ
ncbi:Protein of unknown function [Cotesia congregata]|uniref:Uncharacterized protein n=1 Tax=Cotesia congregata TaxID=51543 RepID=A0A8J2MDR3_COTCN|nr:Protein of unknown function [Cotesia congregata]